jgi:hypothetical protein
MSACDPLLQAERRFKYADLNPNQVGFVPLPRAGGALSHTMLSIGYLQRCGQRWFVRSLEREGLLTPNPKASISASSKVPVPFHEAANGMITLLRIISTARLYPEVARHLAVSYRDRS